MEYLKLSYDENSREAAVYNAVQSAGSKATELQKQAIGEYAGALFDAKQKQADLNAAIAADPVRNADKTYSDATKQLKRQLDEGIVDQQQFNQESLKLAQDHANDIAKANANSVVTPAAEAAGTVDPVQQLANENAKKLALIQQYEANKTITEQQGIALRNAANTQYEQQRIAAQWQMFAAQSQTNQLIADTVDALGGSVTSSITGLISGTTDLQSAISSISNTILNELVGSFVKMGVEWVKSAIMGQTAQVAATAATTSAAVVGPFFSPVDSSQLWVHTQSALGGNSETNWKMTIWKVDENNVQIPGTTQVFTYRQTTPHDSSSETFYRTEKITPTGGFGRYAISFQRTDNSSDASTLKVEEIHSVNIRNNVVHPTDSIVRITVRATENATGSRERKYNALITRHTITYNLSTQSVDYTLRPSRSFADAVIHTWLVMGKQSESSIDIFELYSIAASLPDVRLGYFDYTFDDEDISLGSRVQTICDAATVTAFWDDGVLSFSRDEKKSNPVTVFNRANMTTEGYSLSYDMTLPGGFDGVEVEYRNPTTNKQDYIRYKIAGSTILEGEPVKPKKFEMLYVRDAYQARDRAIKEVRRLLYSRITAAITAMADGEWINVGQMIQIADIYDENQQDGYITGRVGNTFDTSERINFSGDMYVVVTDSQGNVTSRALASARSDTHFGFIATVPNIALNIWDGVNVQSPSRYIIATQVEQDATKWTVTEKKPNSSGTTSITAVEYSDEMFNYLIA